MPKRVLVTDDEPSITDSVVAILAQQGFEAMGAYNGQGALDAAQTQEPDLLLSDVLMPGMNGFELALAIKERYPACKLLLFSGQAATIELAARYGDRFTALGHRYELLPKPIHPAILIQRVEEALQIAA